MRRAERARRVRPWGRPAGLTDLATTATATGGAHTVGRVRETLPVLLGGGKDQWETEGGRGGDAATTQDARCLLHYFSRPVFFIILFFVLCCVVASLQEHRDPPWAL